MLAIDSNYGTHISNISNQEAYSHATEKLPYKSVGILLKFHCISIAISGCKSILKTYSCSRESLRTLNIEKGRGDS